jgi:hypothetical protein
MVTWFFENSQFSNAWIPFDRINQRKLEYVYRHYEELVNYIQQNKTDIIKDIDPEEEDASVHHFLQYDQQFIYIHLKDSHFEHPITIYPSLLLASLPDKDMLIVRTDHNTITIC